MQTTIERLEGYYPFSDLTLGIVDDIAEEQSSQTLRQVFDKAGFKGTEVRDFGRAGQIEIADFRRDEEDNVVVYQLPMANPLDTNQLFQVSTLAAALPYTRFIAVGNPSGDTSRFDGGALTTHTQRRELTRRRGSLGPVVDPINRYLDAQGIEEVDQVGYSYGVEKALAMAATGCAAVSEIVAIEPVSDKKRTSLALGMTFGKTAKALKGYIADSESPAFAQARETAIKPGKYNQGLVRLTNIAIARYMAKGRFFDNASAALGAQPDARLTAVWGSNTEFGTDKRIAEVLENLGEAHGQDRVNGMRLKGGKHALANDIYLQTAVVLEAVNA